MKATLFVVLQLFAAKRTETETNYPLLGYLYRKGAPSNTRNWNFLSEQLNFQKEITFKETVLKFGSSLL